MHSGRAWLAGVWHQHQLSGVARPWAAHVPITLLTCRLRVARPTVAQQFPQWEWWAAHPLLLAMDPTHAELAAAPACPPVEVVPAVAGPHEPHERCRPVGSKSNSNPNRHVNSFQLNLLPPGPEETLSESDEPAIDLAAAQRAGPAGEEAASALGEAAIRREAAPAVLDPIEELSAALRGRGRAALRGGLRRPAKHQAGRAADPQSLASFFAAAATRSSACPPPAVQLSHNQPEPVTPFTDLPADMQRLAMRPRFLGRVHSVYTRGGVLFGTVRHQPSAVEIKDMILTPPYLRTAATAWAAAYSWTTTERADAQAAYPDLGWIHVKDAAVIVAERLMQGGDAAEPARQRLVSALCGPHQPPPEQTDAVTVARMLLTDVPISLPVVHKMAFFIQCCGEAAAMSSLQPLWLPEWLEGTEPQDWPWTTADCTAMLRGGNRNLPGLFEQERVRALLAFDMSSHPATAAAELLDLQRQEEEEELQRQVRQERMRQLLQPAAAKPCGPVATLLPAPAPLLPSNCTRLNLAPVFAAAGQAPKKSSPRMPNQSWEAALDDARAQAAAGGMTALLDQLQNVEAGLAKGSADSLLKLLQQHNLTPTAARLLPKVASAKELVRLAKAAWNEISAPQQRALTEDLSLFVSRATAALRELPLHDERRKAGVALRTLILEHSTASSAIWSEWGDRMLLVIQEYGLDSADVCLIDSPQSALDSCKNALRAVSSGHQAVMFRKAVEQLFLFTKPTEEDDLAWMSLPAQPAPAVTPVVPAAGQLGKPADPSRLRNSKVWADFSKPCSVEVAQQVLSAALPGCLPVWTVDGRAKFTTMAPTEQLEHLLGGRESIQLPAPNSSSVVIRRPGVSGGTQISPASDSSQNRNPAQRGSPDRQAYRQRRPVARSPSPPARRATFDSRRPPSNRPIPTQVRVLPMPPTAPPRALFRGGAPEGVRRNQF